MLNIRSQFLSLAGRLAAPAPTGLNPVAAAWIFHRVASGGECSGISRSTGSRCVLSLLLFNDGTSRLELFGRIVSLAVHMVSAVVHNMLDLCVKSTSKPVPLRNSGSPVPGFPADLMGFHNETLLSNTRQK
jgi:hypothetical protein